MPPGPRAAGIEAVQFSTVLVRPAGNDVGIDETSHRRRSHFSCAFTYSGPSLWEPMAVIPLDDRIFVRPAEPVSEYGRTNTTIDYADDRPMRGRPLRRAAA